MSHLSEAGPLDDLLRSAREYVVVCVICESLLPVLGLFGKGRVWPLEVDEADRIVDSGEENISKRVARAGLRLNDSQPKSANRLQQN